MSLKNNVNAILEAMTFMKFLLITSSEMRDMLRDVKIPKVIDQNINM